MEVTVKSPFFAEECAVKIDNRGFFLEKSKVIAVDFDGVIKSGSNWEDMDAPLTEYCAEALDWLYSQGFEIILWTSRDGNDLDRVKSYLIKNNIIQYFNGFNEPAKSLNFHQGRKIFANYYVDDLNSLGFEGWVMFCARVKEDLCYSTQ